MSRWIKELCSGRIRVPVGVHAISLMLVALLVAPAALAEDPPVCSSRIAHVLTVDNFDWASALTGTSDNVATMPTTNCNALPFTEATVDPRGGFIVSNWRQFLTPCAKNLPDVAVVKLTIPEGSCGTYATEAVFRDGETVVRIPEMTNPLPVHGGYIRMKEVISVGNRSTFVALIPENGGATRAAVTVYDGDGLFKARQVVDVPAWYEIPVYVLMGSLEIENIGSGVGVGESDAAFYAVGFAGYFNGGSPRVLPAELVEVQP